MNVLMLAPGDIIHSLRPLNWLLERNCRVTFVDNQRPKPVTLNSFTYAPYPVLRSIRFVSWLGRRRQEWLRRFILSKRLRLIRWRSGADVVHVHYVNLRAYDCLRAGLRPLVLTVWGSDVNGLLLPNSDERVRVLVGKALAAADLVLVDSADMPEKCAALAGGPVATAFLPLGIDTAHFRPVSAEEVSSWRRRLDIPDRAMVFMSVRAMAPLYGHHQILEAFSQVCHSIVRKPILVFKIYNRENYGEGAAYEANLRKKAEELGVTECIRWVAATPYADLPALYGLADVIVNYPCMDGFPVTFMEAAACKRPVISASLPAYRGTFAEEAFQLVPPDNIEALAAALRSHMVCEPRIANLDEVRDRVVREYDQTVSATRLLEHYHRLARLGGKPK
jgi:glycosyltransferase involved in cell wall biosynthesis